jgi:prophage regulatory protein
MEVMRDVLEELMLDAGSRTVGELIQERAWAAQEINLLRLELAKLRDSRVRAARASVDRENTGGRTTPESLHRLVRLSELTQMMGVSRSTIYLMVKQGRFPQPVHFGRTSAWRLTDIVGWQDALRP